jgi:hypothetical protein
MRRSCLSVGAVLAIVASTPVHSQDRGPSEASHLRNDCRLASQVIRTGHPHTRREWAEQFIDNCPESGPAAFVDVWITVPADSARLKWLVNFSSRLRDQRLVNAAAAILRDRSRPDLVRIGAMLLLMRYADPSELIGFSHLSSPPAGTGPIRMVMGNSATHPRRPLEGSEPLASGFENSVLLFLQEIAATDASPSVRYAAARLAKTLAHELES